MKLQISSAKYGVQYVLYDKSDHAIISQHKWGLNRNRNGEFYASTSIWENGKNRKIYMHRLVMGFPNGIVDHKFFSTLDNRKSKLRIVNSVQSAANKRKMKNNKSGYKGVVIVQDYFRAYISVNGKQINGGRFTTAIAAAVKYNQMAVKYYGEHACLNKINQPIKKYEKELNAPRHLIKGNKTGYRGVSFIPRLDKMTYHVRLSVNDRTKNIGTFYSLPEAIAAYNSSAIKYHGLKAKLNPIP